MKIKSLIFVLLSAAMCNVASAQSYLSLGVGLTSLDETDIRVSPGTVTTDYNRGEGLRAAYGYQFTSFRAEIEIARYENDVDNHALNGEQLTGAKGEASALALMANVYFDFDTGSQFTPYVGAGLGNIDLDFSSYGVDAIPVVLNDDDAVLGYQFMLGAAYELSETTSLFGEYRYIAADEATVQTSFETGGVETGIDYDASVLQFGVNLQF